MWRKNHVEFCLASKPSVDSHGQLLVSPSVMHGHGQAHGFTVL